MITIAREAPSSRLTAHHIQRPRLVSAEHPRVLRKESPLKVKTRRQFWPTQGSATATSDVSSKRRWCTSVADRHDRNTRYSIDECLQLFGGYGPMTEYLIARMYGDADQLRGDCLFMIESGTAGF